MSASAPSVVDTIESKLKEEEWLVSAWSPVNLNRILNQWYFKRGVNEVSALKLWQGSCQCLCLPRLMNSDVFVQAVTAGCANRDDFGCAAVKEGERWLGFVFGHSALVTMGRDSLQTFPRQVQDLCIDNCIQIYHTRQDYLKLNLP